MEIIRRGTEEWQSLKEEIINSFAEGDLITKEWLRDKLCIEDWTLKQFHSAEEMKQAWTEWTFTFLTLMSELKEDILIEYKVCLKTMWGQGYQIVPAEETVQYGYDEFVDDVNKSMKKAQMIFDNAPMVSPWRQSYNRDIIARFESAKCLLKSLKKKNYEG